MFNSINNKKVVFRFVIFLLIIIIGALFSLYKIEKERIIGENEVMKEKIVLKAQLIMSSLDLYYSKYKNYPVDLNDNFIKEFSDDSFFLGGIDQRGEGKVDISDFSYRVYGAKYELCSNFSFYKKCWSNLKN